MASKLDQEGWPVTTQEPYDLVTELGLPPGPALLACSGSDIVLSRGASAKPSVAKQKGRYVIMLPGILSLRPKSKESPDAGADKTGEDADDRDGTTDGATDELQADVATKSKATITSTLLGRMEGLSTDTPVLKIPYPNGGCLTFQGHKVNDSTSRFMMLSFKKGDVVCKDAVSSVIVFGESTYSGPECTDVVELDELTHYGGSDRTIDGGKSVKVKKGTRPVVKTARLTQITTEVLSQTIKTPIRKTPKAKVLVTSDVDEDDSDAYLDDTRDIHSNHALDSARRSSRRSASSKVSYAVDEDEEDGDDDVEVEVDDEQSSDDDGEEADSKKLARKRTPAKPKAALASDPDEQEEEKPSKSTRKRAPAKPVLDSDFEMDEGEKPSQPTPSRARSKPKTVLDSDSDDGQKDEKPSMSARKRAPAKRQPVLDLESDYEEEEEETSKPARKPAPAKLKHVLDLVSDNEEKKTSKPARRRAPAKPKPVVDLDYDNEVENPSKLARKRAPAKPQVVLDVDDSDGAAAVNPVMKPTRKRGARNLQKEEFEPSSTQRSVRRSTSKKSALEDAVNLDDRESVDERNVEKSSKRASHKAREGVTSSDGRGSAADGMGSASAPKAVPTKRKAETVVIDIAERLGDEVLNINADKVSASRARKSHVTSKANGKAIGSGNYNADDDGIDEDFTQEYTPSAKKKELHGKIGRDDGVKENEPPKKRNRTTLAPSSQKSSVLADEKSKSPVSRSLVMASPRSRRRRKPAGVPTSHSPKPQVDMIKSNPDDEYGTFDFSADDIAVLATPEKRVRVKART